MLKIKQTSDNQSLSLDRLDRMAKRFERLFVFLVPLAAILSALAVVALIILAVGESPIAAYKSLLTGAFGTGYDLANSLNRATPLILVGLGVAFAFRGGLLNIGGEGQIMMGGLFATVVGIYAQGLPAWLHIPLTLLAGFVGGALWGLVPGYFYAKYGTNIIITAILMNDIAIGIVSALVKGPLQEPPGHFPQSPMIQLSAKLPLIVPEIRLHAGLLVGLVLAVLLYFLLFRSPFGYQIRTVGENLTAAKYSGMKVFGIQILIMVISGGLAGLAGTVEILGSQFRLRPAFLPNYGYEALAVALLGQKHPFGVILSGILFGALKAGRGSMQRATNLPMSLSFVLSGVIILFVVASSILNNLPSNLAKKQAGETKNTLLQKIIRLFS